MHYFADHNKIQDSQAIKQLSRLIGKGNGQLVNLGLSRWNEEIQVAAAAIVANRLRSILTVIGIVIGIAVVTLVAALLEGAQTFISNTASSLKGGVVQVEKASFQDFIGDGQAFVEAQAKRPDITIGELESLQSKLEGQFEVGAEVSAALPVQRANKTLNGVAIRGVTANSVTLTSIKIARGRELTDFDDRYRRSVCIIGADVDEFLFPDRDPIGQMIKVGSAEYQVIGVAEPLGSSFGASQDGFVQLPLGTFAKIFGARSRSISLLVKARDGIEMSTEDVEDRVRFEMRLIRGLEPQEDDNFSFITARSVEAFAGRIAGVVAVVLYPLTAIGLVVGGIVVMNMMLASVTERTREIGIRLAIGARRSDILAQFLIESTMLTLVGGVIGIGVAGLLILSAAKLSGFPLSLPAWAVAAAFLVSTSVGLIFGVVPARRASRLNPIDALRKE